MADDELDPLPDVDDEMALGTVAWCVERPTDQGDSHRGDDERRRVDPQRQAGPDRRGEEPGNRRPDDEPRAVDHLEVGVGLGESGTTGDRRDGGGVGGEEQRAKGAHRRGDDEDHRHRRAVQHDGQRDERGQRGAAQVAQDHHPLLVAAVGDGARKKAEHEIGQRLQRADDAHREPRAGQREDEQRQGREADGVADGRDALGDDEGPEVAIARERAGIRVRGRSLVERGACGVGLDGRDKIARHRAMMRDRPRRASLPPATRDDEPHP